MTPESTTAELRHNSAAQEPSLPLVKAFGLLFIDGEYHVLLRTASEHVQATNGFVTSSK
jgi:hypothetical protein